jgi:YebC/PmpR family DNA-binding regulatory protein
MFARWNRMAKQFARISKDINMAVKAGGPDPQGNPTLRRILQNARAVNMPKDKVEAAIKRASGRDATNYETVIYEGYAPHGVPLLIETATDNPTRTVATVRNIITKNGGNLGTNGSVSFMFRKMGVFRLDPAGIDQDDLELYLIDHGLDEMGESTGEKGEAQLVARCAFEDFGKLQEALETRKIAPLSAEHEYIPMAPTELGEADAAEVLALVDKLEQEDDVQSVFHTLAGLRRLTRRAHLKEHRTLAAARKAQRDRHGLADPQRLGQPHQHQVCSVGREHDATLRRNREALEFPHAHHALLEARLVHLHHRCTRCGDFEQFIADGTAIDDREVASTDGYTRRGGAQPRFVDLKRHRRARRGCHQARCNQRSLQYAALLQRSPEPPQTG